MSDTDKRSLLLVEDDVVIAFAEQRWLKDYGYNVTHVLSGQEAVDCTLSKENAFDLILMDINLGEGMMDGTEAARLILEKRDIPVVFLSSHTEPEIVARTEKITSYGYVVKDSGITVLDASIKMAFRLFESRQREKEKDKALVESEMRFRRAMEGSRDGLWDWNLLTDEAYFSDRYASMLGYCPDELPPTGEAWYGLLHSEDKEQAIDVLQDYLDGKSAVYESIFRMKTKEGSYRWVLGKGQAVWDEQGQPVRITGINTDVTDSKRDRVYLEESLERYHAIFDNAREGILIAEAATGRFRFANTKALSMFAYSHDELMEMSIPDLHEPGFFPNDFPIQGENNHEQGIVRKIPCLRKNGELFYCDTSSGTCMLEGRLHLIAYFYELPDQIRLQSELKKERDLFSEGPVSSFIWQPEEGWPILYVSRNIKETLGYSSEELMSPGVKYADLIHPQDRERIRKEVDFNSAMGENQFDQSYRIRHKDGSYLWILDFTRFQRDGDGRVCEIHGYMFDQSRLKQAEEEILRQKERLSGIIAGTKLGTWEWNLSTDEVLINDQWAAMLGYTVEELAPVTNETWISLTHVEDIPESNRRIKEHLEGRCESYSCEVRMKHKNGSWVWILDKGKVTEWTKEGDALWIFGTQQDITERKRNEKAIRQQLHEKEILLREVHHRIKNNMNSVSSLLKLQQGMDDGPDIIQKAIGRLEGMRVLYEKLLFTEKYKHIAVKSYLEDLVDSIIRIFPDRPGIAIYLDIEDMQMDTREIFPLGLIVNELITNSMKYAFGKKPGDDPVGTIRVTLVRHGEEIVLCVSDDGVGLPGDFNLESSSGFGLKLVRMLSRQLGGKLMIENCGGVCSEIRCKSPLNIPAADPCAP